jgi:excinuclease ABC subunit C
MLLSLKIYLKIPVKIPYKGDKKKLMDMASNNAKITLEKEIELIKKDESKTSDANLELKNILKLNKLDRIEIFDNSNLFGTFNVSGMVVFIDGKPYKNEYRKYKISIDKNDDYGTMKEVIYRRYFRVLKDNLSKPDLIIIDGGLGQINVARDVLSSLNLNIPIVGLKKGKKHTTEALLAFNPIEEINISKNSNLFYYLERMQEEVHNYTISYHKQIRSKGLLESFLDNINGIGKKRKEELLDKYKTINKLKELTKEELELILPETVALELIKKLEEYE